MDILVKLLVTGGLIGILDFMWLRFAARQLYESEMPRMLLDKPLLAPAAIFYVLYVVGVVWFVVAPAIEKSSWTHALLSGALFGLVAYGTYGMTNLAVFKGFSAKAMAIDMAWGVFLTAAASTGAYFIVRMLIVQQV